MALRNPATVAVLILALVLISDSNFASAASGGQSGGSLFPSGGGSSSSSSGSSGSSDSSWSWDHHHSPSSGSSTDGGFYGFLIFAAVIVGVLVICHCAGVGKLSVVKLQVGLVGKAPSLQKDLNRLTETTDMSTATGLSHLLTGASTSLLRNLDYCISSYSSVTRKSEMEDAEQCFKQLSMSEAAKFSRVTLSNVNNFVVRSTIPAPNVVHKEYIVVTILVSTRGAQKLPSINGRADLKKALQSLGSIPSSKLLAVEVLWTPQQENDTLTEKELLRDYLHLRGFYVPGSLEEGSYDDSYPFLGVTVDKDYFDASQTHKPVDVASQGLLD